MVHLIAAQIQGAECSFVLVMLFAWGIWMNAREKRRMQERGEL